MHSSRPCAPSPAQPLGQAGLEGWRTGGEGARWDPAAGPNAANSAFSFLIVFVVLFCWVCLFF